MFLFSGMLLYANDRSADVGISNRINDVNKDQKA